MDDGSGGRNQGLLHLHPQKYIGAESGVTSPKAFIYRYFNQYFMKVLNHQILEVHTTISSSTPIAKLLNHFFCFILPYFVFI